MKKILSLLLAILILTSTFSVIATAANVDVATQRYKYFTYEYSFYDDGTVGITDYTGSETNLVVPNTIDTYTVKSIYDGAFKWCSSLESVTISNGIKIIGNSAFDGCGNLASVTIPDSVESIGNYAFSDCDDLTSVNMGNGVKQIGKGAFDRCFYLPKITLPDSLTTIGAGAFAYCHKLNNVVIPEGVKSIEARTFYVCHALDNVSIPDSVESIGDSAFGNCKSLAFIDIPDAVASIGNYAFSDCANLLAITIPNSVKSIGEQAFENCSDLMLVTLPNSIKSISYSAFSGCTSLESVTIPDGVESIDYSAFDGCVSLVSVTIPNSVKSIGDRAFYGCSSLKSATILDGVESIGSYAFYNCDKITNVYIPDSVTSIGKSAFSSCGALKVVSVPNDSFTSDVFDYRATIINRENLQAKELDNHKLSVSIKEVPVYDGKNKTPKVEVYYEDKLLSEDYDYVLEYFNNDSVSAPIVDVTGVGEYHGLYKSTPFTILPKDVSDSLNVEVRSFSCDPEECELYVTTSDGVELEESYDFEKSITYGSADNEAIIYVVCKGNYTGVYKTHYAFEVLGEQSGEILKYNLNNGIVTTNIGNEILYDKTCFGPARLDLQIKTPYNKIELLSTRILVNGKEYDYYDHIELETGVNYIETLIVYDYYLPSGGSSYIDKNGNIIYTGGSYYKEGTIYRDTSEIITVRDSTPRVEPQAPVDDGTDKIYLGINVPHLFLGGKNLNATWSSSNPSIATVEDGVVTMYKTGNAIITATTPIGDLTWDLNDIKPLDINKNTKVLNFDPQTKQVDIVWKNELLQQGEDYTVSTKDVDGITEVTITGKNLFTGKIVKKYYAGTSALFFEFKLGDTDFDGDINILDATWIQRHLAKLSTFDKTQESAADTDHDGSVSIIDATMIQRYLAKLIDTL